MKSRITASYALLATGYIAQHCQEGKVQASLISQQLNIPRLYLFKVLEQLVKGNILRSRKGRKGGFLLARPAQEITLLEIIEAVDGPLFGPLTLGKPVNNEQQLCLRIEGAYQSAVNEAKNLYSKVKLSEMLKQ